MKKLTIIIFVLIFFQITASSQTCLPCLPEGITFNTQNQIDSFQINFPGCTEIEGYVSIDGLDITSLDALIGLTTIGGKLKIIETSLPNLIGLDSLTTVGEEVGIGMNITLISLHGLENLKSILGNLIIELNPLLPGLAGLDNLETVGGGLGIAGNQIIENCSGLNNLTQVAEDVVISFNPLMASLAGLDKLHAIGGFLHISDNNSLTSLAGLETLDEIVGTFKLNLNPSLTNLSDLTSLYRIGGDLIISNNSSLIGFFKEPEILGFLQGGMIIENNDAVENLTGLVDQLFMGFGGVIKITDNDALTSLSKTLNILPTDIDTLIIQSNSSLAYCAVNWICNYLDTVASLQAYVLIEDNANGCDSVTEVEDDCSHIGIDDNNTEFSCSIYPNPANNELFISAQPGTKIDAVRIYNQIGQKVLHHKPVIQPIDVSMLRPGLYIIEVMFGNRRLRGKFIK